MGVTFCPRKGVVGDRFSAEGVHDDGEGVVPASPPDVVDPQGTAVLRFNAPTFFTITPEIIRERFPADADEVISFGIFNHCYIPLRARGVVVGCLSIARSNDATYGDVDIQLAQTLADES